METHGTEIVKKPPMLLGLGFVPGIEGEEGCGRRYLKKKEMWVGDPQGG